MSTKRKGIGVKTVHEVSELAGVSIRTLQYYDKIGLLNPAARTDAGYRLYDEADLARLQQILLFRELEFPLEDIRRIVDSPDFDRKRALQQQIELLELKRAHIDDLIELAKSMQSTEVEAMSFEAFDTTELDEYTAQAKASWGTSPQWQEFEEKSSNRTKEKERNLGEELMDLFIPFGEMTAAGDDPASDKAREHAARIQAFITEHYYQCADEIFAQLGQTYGAGGDFTANINAHAGDGAAEFAAQAIAAYVKKA